MDKFIIECPSCKVRFFVTDDLLVKAGGALRCGFCMHVFNGNDYIVYKSYNPLNGVDDTQNKYAKEYEAQQPEIVEESSLDKKITYSKEYWTEVVDTLSNFSVDFKSSKQEELSTVTENIKEEETLQQEVNTVLVLDTSPESIDADILEKIDHVDFDRLLQLDEEELVVKQGKDISELFNEDHGVEDQNYKVQADNDEIDVNDNSTVQHPTANDIPKDIYGNCLKKVSDLDFMMAPPKNKATNKHVTLWVTLSLLAVLALVGQYLRYVAPEMAKVEASRETAETICQYLWCEIPDYVDVAHIETNQLSVRSNPNYDNVLNVDAIISNSLTIPQPFPLVELRFTDLNGQLVASRRFSPSDYLTNDMAQQMLPNTPVYISFEIVDPGEVAVGHALQYYPAK